MKNNLLETGQYDDPENITLGLDNTMNASKEQGLEQEQWNYIMLLFLNSNVIVTVSDCTYWVKSDSTLI